MEEKKKNTLTLLAICITVLAILAAGGGIFWQGSGDPYPFTTLRGEVVKIYGHGLYRYESIMFAAQAIGQDIATLAVGIPLFIVGILLARKGSLRGQLLLTGGLGYFLYTYTTYAFLSAYNQFFLLYVALFSLSLFAFILAFSELDAEFLAQRITDKFPSRSLATFLTLLAVFLGMAWLGRILPALLAGIPPYGLEAASTLDIQAMDLGIIVPASILTAILLWRKRSWGYKLAGVLTIKGLMMGAALIAMIIGQILAGVAVSMFEIVMFSVIAFAALVFTLLTFRNIVEKP